MTEEATTQEAIQRVLIQARNEEGIVTMLYRNKDGELSARTVWPLTLGRGVEGHIWMRGYDSRRSEVRTFRLSRIMSAHRVEA